MLKHSSKPLIIHVIDSLEIGGAEKLLVNTIEALPEYDHMICYLGGANKFPVINNLSEIICLDHKSNSNFLKTVFKLRKIIDRKKPILVHAHLLKSTWVSRPAAFGKCPLIFTIHNKLSEDAFKVNRLSHYFEKLTYRKDQAIIGVSNEVISDYKQWVGIKGQAFVLYNMIEDKFFKSGLKKTHQENKLRLIAVGNLRRQKNYSNLLKAFLHLKDYDISLDIYGGGDEYDSLNAFIKENKLPIQLKGKVNNIVGVMREYDAFILPSFFEGYGIAVVEAMAAELPVILSDIDVFREVSDNEAIYFDPSSPESISNAILQLYNTAPEKMDVLKDKMKKRAIEIGSPALFKKSIIKIYEDLICLKN